MKVREPVMSDHAKRVIRWRESFLHLDENRFFEVMRMYLGEIKTPYNKQNLIASLESFLHKKENLVAIKSFLSDDELTILCAAVFIPRATEKKLTAFFAGTFSYSFLYETLLNLEERLILFRTKKSVYENLLLQNSALHLSSSKSSNFSTYSNFNDDEFIIEMNPFLEDCLFDLIDIARLLPEIKFKKIESEKTQITPELILCFISYVIENPQLAKQDGTLKKHTEEDAQKYFGASTKMICVLYKAFLNLGLVKEKERGVELDWQKLNNFVEKDFVEQLVYFVVSNCGHFSRESLRHQAQVFIDTLTFLREKSFTLNSFLKTGFLSEVRPLIATENSQKNAINIEENDSLSGGAKISRFAKMLQEGRQRLSAENSKVENKTENNLEKNLSQVENQNSTQNQNNVAELGFLEIMFDAALILGIISKCGITQNKEDVFKIENFFFVNSVQQNIQKNIQQKSSLSGMINIEAGFDISLMPLSATGFKISDALILTKFTFLKRYDTVCAFSISRKSVMRGFDLGLSQEKIISILTERALYELPQVLLVQLEDWSESYSSAAFYKGFVLKVEGKAAVAAQNNPIFAPHIHTVIAPGIFLLDVQDDAEALSLIKESGLDFIGKIKTAVHENRALDFFKLNLSGRKIDEKNGFDAPKEIYDKINSAEIEKSLKLHLKNMTLEEEQRESLELRIEHKVIINPAQLNANILRLERVNANAMDFGGKIYVIEQAIKNDELVELKFEKNVILGKPILVRKEIDDSYVEVQLVPENVVREFSLGKANFVKRIRKSIYRS